MKVGAILAGALVLAAGAGFLASQAVGVGSQAPTQTVTVNIPSSSGGAESCPTGSTFKAVLFNAPGGQTTIYTCVKT